MICVGNSEAGFSYIIEPFSFPGVKVVKKWLARVLSVFTAGLILSPLAAKAQQITGELGSPSATTTIDGKQLPAPEPAWSGQINNNALQSKPWWPPRIVPPKSMHQSIATFISRMFSRYTVISIMISTKDI